MRTSSRTEVTTTWCINRFPHRKEREFVRQRNERRLGQLENVNAHTALLQGSFMRKLLIVSGKNGRGSSGEVQGGGQQKRSLQRQRLSAGEKVSTKKQNFQDKKVVHQFSLAWRECKCRQGMRKSIRWLPISLVWPQGLGAVQQQRAGASMGPPAPRLRLGGSCAQCHNRPPTNTWMDDHRKGGQTARQKRHQSLPPNRPT